MGTGRPAKSNERKETAGTLHNERVTHTLPPPEPTLNLPVTFPDPPEYLNETGIRAYKMICTHLNSVNALWPVDINMVNKAAFWTQLWEETVLTTIGNTIQTFPNGTQQISPQIQVLDKAETHVRKYYELLGIGPKARESIGVFQVSGGATGNDPFSLMLSALETADAQIQLPDNVTVA